jgi:2-oxoglutarate ferredoxin oxidoreductase subunit gamma
MSERIEILISGFGGQGVVKAGRITGEASVLQGLFTTMLVSHGTETRGGYVRTQVVLSDEEIDSPVLESPAVFCALSGAAYQRFFRSVTQGLIVYDPAYVQPDLGSGIRHLALPARDLAVSRLGGELFANMIVYGKLIALLDGKISKENARQALRSVLTRKTEENLNAFEIGFAYR